MQNKDFFSGVPIEVREFLLRLLNSSNQKRQLPFTDNCLSLKIRIEKAVNPKTNCSDCYEVLVFSLPLLAYNFQYPKLFFYLLLNT